MTFAEQVGVELVDVAALLAADVALPGVGVAVAALVQEVERGVGERDGAEGAHERGGRRRGVAVRRRDHAALRRRRARAVGAASAASGADAAAQVLAQQALERRHLDERRQAGRHAALVAVRLALRLAAARLLRVRLLLDGYERDGGRDAGGKLRERRAGNGASAVARLRRAATLAVHARIGII